MHKEGHRNLKKEIFKSEEMDKNSKYLYLYKISTDVLK